jgi:biopolymer transport protein ExbD
MDEGHVVVLIGRHDEIIIDDEIIPMEEMAKLLAPGLKENPNKVITVKADAAAPANRVIDVMDAIKVAGGRNLSVVTQSKVTVRAE